MNANVYVRMYGHLIDLIPNLAGVEEGASYYAPPKQSGDMALYATVTSVAKDSIMLEIAHDMAAGCANDTSTWMVFQIDPQTARAELRAYQDEAGYTSQCGGQYATNPNGAGINIFAANWLALLLSLQFTFQSAVPLKTVAEALERMQ